jgi:tetratricopeptide (TPR) repeat protein
VLVIDDAQYADDGLLDFLDHLLGSARAGIFVVALARPELLARRHDLGGRRTTVVRLEPLDDSDMAQLIDGLVDGFSPDVREALVRRAEGVPLFAVETVRALIDRDAIVPRNGRYVPAEGIVIDLDAVGAPASLQALVAARLDALTPEERRVVADASVLGASFTKEGLKALGSDPDQLDAALASLQRKEILTLRVDRFSAEAGQCGFVQGVVRQVAYSTQSKRDRKSRHLAASEYLQTLPGAGDDLALVIAQHLLDAVDASTPGDLDVPALTERAGDMLARAAERASSLGSPADAQRIHESALGRATNPAEQGRLHTAAARAALDAGDAQTAAEHAQQATDLFDGLSEPIAAGFAVAVHANALRAMADNTTAIDISEGRLRALDGVPGAESARLLLNQAMGMAHRGRGEFDRAMRFVEPWILLAEALHDYEALADAYLTVGVRYIAIGAPLTAAAMSESAARISREHGDWSILSRAMNNLATYEISRDLGAALERGEEGMEAARRSGVRSQVDLTTLNYALALWTAGRLAAVQAVVSEATETVVNPAIGMCLGVLQAWLSDATGGPLPDAVLLEGTDDASDLAWMANRAILDAMRQGAHAEAARHAAGSIDHLLATAGIEDDFMHLWPPMVEAAIAAGDLGLTERLLDPVATAAAGIVSPAVNAQFHRLRGLVGAARGDDPVGVEADLRVGVAELDDFGAIGLRARAQVDLGRWLVTQGRSDEADSLLDSARATYEEIGATGWLAHLDAVQPFTVV